MLARALAQITRENANQLAASEGDGAAWRDVPSSWFDTSVALLASRPTRQSPYSSLARSASVIIVKPLASSVSRPISMLSTIRATAGRPRGRTSSG